MQMALLSRRPTLPCFSHFGATASERARARAKEEGKGFRGADRECGFPPPQTPGGPSEPSSPSHIAPSLSIRVIVCSQFARDFVVAHVGGGSHGGGGRGTLSRDPISALIRKK